MIQSQRKRTELNHLAPPTLTVALKASSTLQDIWPIHFVLSTPISETKHLSKLMTSSMVLQRHGLLQCQEVALLFHQAISMTRFASLKNSSVSSTEKKFLERKESLKS